MYWKEGKADFLLCGVAREKLVGNYVSGYSGQVVCDFVACDVVSAIFFFFTWDLFVISFDGALLLGVGLPTYSLCAHARLPTLPIY